MGHYTATIQWRRGEDLFTDNKYSRAHTVAFDAPLTLPASSSPSVIPLPFSRADAVDPEEMLVAALSSCHMLSFLYEARKAGFVVDAYDDAAEGVLAKDADGRLAMTRTTLSPKIMWAGDKRPSAEEIEHLHHLAHEACFIANSYKGEVVVA
jgi:organic hydroperoxide reductase OsmC/OhrA